MHCHRVHLHKEQCGMWYSRAKIAQQARSGEPIPKQIVVTATCVRRRKRGLCSHSHQGSLCKMYFMKYTRGRQQLGRRCCVFLEKLTLSIYFVFKQMFQRWQVISRKVICLKCCLLLVMECHDITNNEKMLHCLGDNKKTMTYLVVSHRLMAEK